ncbi:hypothetical protein SCRM01_107c [Synechococcus phage S-CRM01]|uniref:hypothetical protein n=1 Tax=Synechococcus phage S-CRM01 TaxID=1026955 RepID=UPI000209E3A7|nr:hypothetical protein SCRM01_107c [Synechococcus phage S-CRM01]AEC53053.1 hypothetical protein SCRM01_107c [Synechococcus phage S-CRM01]
MTETNCWATFTGKNGYPFQNEQANEELIVGQRYKVVGGRVNNWSTSLKLEGIPGSFNSVMFLIEGELPFKYEDHYLK